MRKLYFALICLAIFAGTDISYSQIYVKNGSYMFVKDQMVYVTQNVDIDPSSNIYLRTQSQLLQGTSGSSTNTGAGKLSVFQEGNVDNYEYNYWCSPIGNASATLGNEPFGITMLNQPTSVTASTPAIILGASALDGIANPLSIAPRWIYRFLGQSTYAGWAATGAMSTIEAGEGFTMKGTSGADASFSDNGATNNPGGLGAQRYDFRGKPNDGNISINVLTGKKTLTGNPYPSAIDLKAFLLSATNTTQTAYFWEQDRGVNSHLIAAYNGGYGTYSPMGGAAIVPYGNMGVYVPAVFYAYDGAGTTLTATGGTGGNYNRRFSPIGQGFMIEGTADATVAMTNNFRVYQKEGSYSDFERPSTYASDANGGFLPPIASVSGFDYTTVSTRPVPQIKFRTLMNNVAVKEIVLAMIPGATDGIDIGMDAKSPDSADLDMYFSIDEKAFVISAIEYNIEKRIPVDFKNSIAAVFKIQVNEMLNFNEVENVYLFDRERQIYSDIKTQPYEFELLPGLHHGRFEITFKTDGALAINQIASANVNLLQNNYAQTLTLNNPKFIEIQKFGLFDITGKKLLSKSDIGTSGVSTFSTSQYADGVYIVKMTTEAGDLNQKIIIGNRKN